MDPVFKEEQERRERILRNVRVPELRTGVPGRNRERTEKVPDETGTLYFMPPEEPKKKKKHGFLKGLLIFFLSLLILAGVLFSLVYFNVGKTNYEPMRAFYEDPAWGLMEPGAEGVKNILLIGTDARAIGEDSRSDAVLVASVCPKQKKIYLHSFLRDSYVEIPGYGKNRLNHAYQMGGASLLSETIEKNFGLRIDNYIKADFFSFIRIIDALGGVEITVTQPELRYVDGYLAEVNRILGLEAEDGFLYEPGTYLLNGRQALAYSRIRYIGTDFGRTERQRTVIAAMVKSAKKLILSPRKLVSAGNEILEALTTDIKDLDMTFLLFRSPFLTRYEMVNGAVPEDGLWWEERTESGQEVLGIDLESTKQALRERIYGAGR